MARARLLTVRELEEAIKAARQALGHEVAEARAAEVLELVFVPEPAQAPAELALEDGARAGRLLQADVEDQADAEIDLAELPGPERNERLGIDEALPDADARLVGESRDDHGR